MHVSYIDLKLKINERYMNSAIKTATEPLFVHEGALKNMNFQPRAVTEKVLS